MTEKDELYSIIAGMLYGTYPDRMNDLIKSFGLIKNALINNSLAISGANLTDAETTQILANVIVFIVNKLDAP